MSKDIRPLVKVLPFQFLLFTSEAMESEFLCFWRYIIAADVFSLVQFSHSVMSDFLQPQGLQHARLPCPSPTSGACSNSCPSSERCHPTISSSLVPFSSCPQSFPSIRVFSNESTLQMRWSKYWSFSLTISPSNEHPGLISFRMDWFDLLAVQGTLKSLLQHYSSKASILWHSAFFTTLTSIHDYWKNHSLD